MSIQHTEFDTSYLRRQLESAGMSQRQVETVARAVGSACALQEHKAVLRELELKSALELSMTKLQGKVYRLEAQLEFARKIAQTSFIGLGGLAILLMFAL
jgi:hypothetical protein